MTLQDPRERRRGYAVERDLELERPKRVRPRLGGESTLPASGASSALFLVQAEDLTVPERAAAGWCVRVGVPEAVPGTGQYDMHELLVEVTITTAGVAHVIELNAFPGSVLHVVGEQISATVKWGTAPVVVPAGVLLRWQLARGLCETSAVRGYTVQAATEGQVPPFATGFALFSGDADVTEDIQLDFATHPDATRVIQHYTRNDLLQTIGAFAPLPPGAGEWRWLTATADPVRLVFSLGGA